MLNFYRRKWAPLLDLEMFIMNEFGYNDNKSPAFNQPSVLMISKNNLYLLFNK